MNMYPWSIASCSVGLRPHPQQSLWWALKAPVVLNLRRVIRERFCSRKDLRLFWNHGRDLEFHRNLPIGVQRCATVQVVYTRLLVRENLPTVAIHTVSIAIHVVIRSLHVHVQVGAPTEFFDRWREAALELGSYRPLKPIPTGSYGR